MGLDIGSIIGQAIGTGIGDTVSKIAEVFKVPPEKVLEANVELEKIRLSLEGQLVQQIGDQIDVDKVEASNPHMFVAGWRPFVGWVCGVGVAIHFIVSPFGTWIAGLCGSHVVFPVLEMKSLLGLLSGMLGFGGLRTYEKIKGIATNQLQ